MDYKSEKEAENDFLYKGQMVYSEKGTFDYVISKDSRIPKDCLSLDC